jgi:hypothetical protein
LADDEVKDREEHEEIGIPEDLRIKRRYTLSDAAIEQRREAAKSTKKSEAMRGNKNAWKHGQYAQGFIERFIKPCKSTCPDYPCSLIEDEGTQPGGVCLDKSEILTTFEAIRKAVKEKEYDDINEIASLKVAGAMQIIKMLEEDILRDGTIFKEKMFSKDGVFLSYKIKSHPSLEHLLRMLPNLGLTLSDLFVTPKMIEKKNTEEEGYKTIGDMLNKVTNPGKPQPEKEADDGND